MIRDEPPLVFERRLFQRVNRPPPPADWDEYTK
jgi:hypothetical protein